MHEYFRLVKFLLQIPIYVQIDNLLYGITVEVQALKFLASRG